MVGTLKILYCNDKEKIQERLVVQIAETHIKG